jgi:hypothetical protein
LRLFSQSPSTSLVHHDNSSEPFPPPQPMMGWWKNLPWLLWKKKNLQSLFKFHQLLSCTHFLTPKTHLPSLVAPPLALSLLWIWIHYIIEEEEIHWRCAMKRLSSLKATLVLQLLWIGTKLHLSSFTRSFSPHFRNVWDMQEQLYRNNLLRSFLDLLFDALSGAPDQRRCLTCA